MEQRTEQWHQARLGMITASRVSDLMAKTKSGYATSRKNYMTELALERITGQREESYSNSYMDRGTELEPEAQGLYEKNNLVTVEPGGFWIHPVMSFLGASPDGLVGDGLIEIKCRKSSFHLDYLTTGKIEQKTIIQMQTQLMCTQRRWCDFISYHPSFPEHLQLWQKRVEIDEKLVDEITDEVKKAESEISGIVEKLNQL